MYSGSQIEIIAYELARSNCHVSSATKILRDQYESFRELNETTVRGFLRRPPFLELISKKLAIVQEARDAAARDAERARHLREYEGSMTGQLRANDRLLDDARKNLERVLDDIKRDPNRDPNVAIRAFGMIAGIVEKTRGQALPAVANTKEASLLITIFAEEAQALFGPEKAKQYRARVRERYVREMETLQREPAAAAS